MTPYAHYDSNKRISTTKSFNSRKSFTSLISPSGLPYPGRILSESRAGPFSVIHRECGKLRSGTSTRRTMRPQRIQTDPHNTAPRAYPIGPFLVLCPVCSYENKLPRTPALIDENGDGLFRCKSCKQGFRYSPFVDRAGLPNLPPGEEVAKNITGPTHEGPVI